jgi:hypothetical protein
MADKHGSGPKRNLCGIILAFDLGLVGYVLLPLLALFFTASDEIHSKQDIWEESSAAVARPAAASPAAGGLDWAAALAAAAPVRAAVNSRS